MCIKNNSMISDETYLKMKELVANYERVKSNKNSDINEPEQPYLVEHTVKTRRKYNPKYGDSRICKCGHSYDRHFDSYDEMSVVGCKYCDCYLFEEEITW